MTVEQAKAAIGIATNQRLASLVEWSQVQQAAKLRIVAARRAEDNQKAASISEAAATLKCYRLANYCACGERKSRNAAYCHLCAWEARRRTRLLARNPEPEPPAKVHRWQARHPVGKLEREMAFYQFRTVLGLLKLWNWNPDKAAPHLGISRATLYRIVSDGCAEWDRCHA